MNKQLLRKIIKAAKEEVSLEEMNLWSEIISRKLTETELFKNAQCIALYYALKDEVRTENIINEWYKKKRIALPVISGNDISFHTYTGKDNLKSDKYGIPEPDNTMQVSPSEIDLVIVPGVAFDRNLNRMGRGKGFYDRFLENNNSSTIGICFDFQILDNIPTEAHDKKMTMIISEKTTVS